mgnify:CR=1 FL=1
MKVAQFNSSLPLSISNQVIKELEKYGCEIEKYDTEYTLAFFPDDVKSTTITKVKKHQIGRAHV